MNNWVMVPVPEDVVPDIMEFVLERVRRSQPTDIESSPPVDAYYGGWTEDELREALKNPTRAMGIVLRYLATHPEERVDGYTLAEAVYGEGASPNQLGGALGSFSRRIKRYGKTQWPFEALHNDERGLWEYWMDADTAEIIRHISGL